MEDVNELEGISSSSEFSTPVSVEHEKSSAENLYKLNANVRKLKIYMDSFDFQIRSR